MLIFIFICISITISTGIFLGPARLWPFSFRFSCASLAQLAINHSYCPDLMAANCIRYANVRLSALTRFSRAAVNSPCETYLHETTAAFSRLFPELLMYVNGLPQTRKIGLCDYTTERLWTPFSVAQGTF